MNRNIFRHEYKYLLNNFQYLILKSRLKFIPKDPNCNENGFYTVKSLYFEDLLGNSLFEKNSGIYRRNKFRIRLYNNSHDFVLLENKIKSGKFTQKNSKVISQSLASHLISDTTLFNKTIRDEFAQINNHTHTRYYQPKAIVDYKREAYSINNSNRLRINFDTSITSSFNKLNFFKNYIKANKITNSNQIVLEIKFSNYLPQFIKILLNSVNTTLISFSKYEKSLSILN